MILALLGPSFGDSKKEIKVIGKDIMIAIDLSESMNVKDIQPSRIEKIKFELKKIVDEFSSDRIGIIMFSNEAFIQCPLTYDKNALRLFIETSRYKSLEKLVVECSKEMKKKFKLNKIYVSIDKVAVAKRYGCESLRVSQ
jgi:hypothetical protein